MGDRTAEIRERLENITPEPWFARNIPSQGYTILWKEPQDGEMLAPICHMRWIDGLHPDVADRVASECEFIAAARSDVPWLVTRLEQAEKLIQEALSETVDASVYSDGPNMSRELRADMRCFLGGE